MSAYGIKTHALIWYHCKYIIHNLYFCLLKLSVVTPYGHELVKRFLRGGKLIREAKLYKIYADVFSKYADICIVQNTTCFNAMFSLVLCNIFITV